MSFILRRLPALGAIAAVALLAAACSGSSGSSTTASSSTASGSTASGSAASGSTASGSNGVGSTALSCTPSGSASTSGTTSTASSGSTVIGRTTTVIVYPSFRAALKKDAIAVAPVSPSSVSKNVLAFPISGGQIVVATFVGTLNHSGGLTFCHDSKSVTLTDFVMNTNTKQLTATMDGKSLPLFDLNLASLRHAKEPKRTVIATNVGLAVTSNAASALNSGLGVTTFKDGQDFGVATLIVAVKS